MNPRARYKRTPAALQALSSERYLPTGSHPDDAANALFQGGARRTSGLKPVRMDSVVQRREFELHHKLLWLSGLVFIFSLACVMMVLSPSFDSVTRVFATLEADPLSSRREVAAHHKHLHYSPMFIDENFEKYPPLCSKARTARVLVEGDFNGDVLDYFWEEILGGSQGVSDVIIPLPMKEQGGYPIHCVRFTYSRRGPNHNRDKQLAEPGAGRLCGYDNGETEPEGGSRVAGHSITNTYDATIFVGSVVEHSKADIDKKRSPAPRGSYEAIIRRRYALQKHIGFILKGSEQCQVLEWTEAILREESRAMFLQHVHELPYENMNGRTGKFSDRMAAGGHVTRFPLGPSTAEKRFPASRRAFIAQYGHTQGNSRNHDVTISVSLSQEEHHDEYVSYVKRLCSRGYTCHIFEFVAPVIVTEDTISADLSAQYSIVLRDSKFVVCPPGGNPETQCVFEAIIAGAIPIVDTRRVHNCGEGLRVWAALGMPAIFLDDWENLEESVSPYLADSTLLGTLCDKMTTWYHKVFINHYRKYTVRQIVQRLGPDARANAQHSADAPKHKVEQQTENEGYPSHLDEVRIRGSPFAQPR